MNRPSGRVGLSRTDAFPIEAQPLASGGILG